MASLKSLFTYLFVVSTIIISVQTNFFQKINKSSVNETNRIHKSFQPSLFELYNINISVLKNSLVNAPIRGNSTATFKLILSFPIVCGFTEKFRIMESGIPNEKWTKIS